MLAFLQEHGPWVMESGGDSFHENEFSWNKNASVLYIEQPAGVGFSYCNHTASDCDFDDMNSSVDNLAALNEWFARFPDFKANDLFVAGESYAGIYVPYLLYQIDGFNKNQTDGDTINLKGMMVGNGVTNWTYDTMPATVDMGYWRSIMSQEMHDNILAEGCDYSGIVFDKNPSESCMNYLNKYQDDIADINIYNIYGTCYGATEEEYFQTEVDLDLYDDANESGFL